ncbi:hypothetical protein [Saccharibacillus sacchari]|uniref:hypothetical protein n=1 Tax=Saccharibacillus sacchari TaxID=456493 RepID=UPI00055B77DD|nr:hypothetical protein [Saccharibacillus sacchari]
MDHKQFASDVTAGLIQASIGQNDVFSVGRAEVFSGIQPNQETVVRVTEGRTAVTIVQTDRDIIVKMRTNDADPQDIQIGPTYVESGHDDVREFLEQAWNTIQKAP